LRWRPGWCGRRSSDPQADRACCTGPSAAADGAGISAFCGILILLSAPLLNLIESVCANKGYKAPIICTPEEMMEEQS
jgi:hypothetical protein